VSNGAKFSLASAKKAGDEDQLAEWVIDFLSSPGSGNAELAAAWAMRGTTYLGPTWFPLDRLTPMAGPDGDDVIVSVAKEDWESDVEDMVHSIEQGWEPPPLLVSHHDGKYFLEDGNHRCETLRREGDTHAWAILIFADNVERSRFLNEQGDVE
jgi:ParB-like nuclease domain